jgi:uncharacterized protein YjbJ (UPF0337 family)
MNTQTLAGSWLQLKAQVREQWGKLTNDDVDVIAGKRDQLVGKIKELYGKTVEEVDREVTAFEKKHLKAD